jgi:hypothetical protein
MGVSKQDWKNYASSQWGGGEVKTTLDELVEAVGRTFAAMDSGDAAEFLSYTKSDGKLMEAAQKAASAASTAVEGMQKLALQGNQRRFANKAAIAACDDAVNAVQQYHMALSLLVTGLVRGVQLEHDQVENDPSALAQVKSGDLGERLEGERHRVEDCYTWAVAKVTDLAGIEKIGVV